MKQVKKILICPLDWGLGHATRCIPLIQNLIEQGMTVSIGGNEVTNQLLRREFPMLQYLELKAYGVRYSKHKWALPFVLLAQIPHILAVINYERRWLKQMIGQHEFDAVISDNRYGLYSANIPCIFITHQLNIAVPRSGILEKFLNRLNHRLIRKFSKLWIPDYPDHRLSGKLSEAKGKLPAISYLGNLSRFQYKVAENRTYDLLFLLSGPEPQRTLLEQMIVSQSRSLNVKMLLVRGKPDGAAPIPETVFLKIKNYLPAQELQEALLQSRIIICRSGYSSIMDLVKLRRSAILIPTPGQTEQEYLAKYLGEKKWFMHFIQQEFHIPDAIEAYQKYRFHPIPDFETEGYKAAISALLMELNS